LGAAGGTADLRFRAGDGDGDMESCRAPGTGSAMDKEHGAKGTRGAWYGRVLDGSLSANILRTDCGLAAPNLGPNW